GFDPLPHYEPPAEFQEHTNGHNDTLMLISGASHHFVSSSMANQPSLMAKEGAPFVEINPADAATRGITHGDTVVIENDRGWCELQAVVTDDVPTGVVVAPKGPWAQHTTAQRNINWTTPDTLADLAGQSTFHSNIVRIRQTQ
ncbi:MAG: molybdopterin dinucleotide binding domain-containing protein, partial [Chloroflexota bacterium]